MITLSEFKKRTGITKTKYIRVWIKDGLIPGIIIAPDIDSTLFPDSARRPYKNRNRIKPNTGADKLRTHIVASALAREHITCSMCHATPREFQSLINELTAAELIQPRVEDGITYYDSTMASELYRGKPFKELRQFVLDAIGKVSEGATTALYNQ